MKSLTIGLAAGINPSVALALKAELIGVGARNDVRVNVVTSEIEMRKDAPDARIELGDRKIAALESVIELERAGCDEVVVPAGKDNHPAIAEIVDVEYFSPDAVPFPIEKTKVILRRCTEEDYHELIN